MKYALLVAIPYVFVLALAANSNWDHPPIDSNQNGFRGTGMLQVENPRVAKDLMAENQPPDELGSVPPGGGRAGDVYENVQVLGDLSEDEFNHFMAAVTQWVAPEEGCGYCHNLENLAEDNVYTKVVARRMMQMTQDINANWGDHVGGAGVNCYTCHRGQHVPEYAWAEDDYHPAWDDGFAASRNNQNRGGIDLTGYASLPYDALAKQLTKTGVEIRVQPDAALPNSDNEFNAIQDAETVYSSMMHLSKGLGVNCTFCHNSRAFANWEQSTPKRVTAWHGIQMAQHLNESYLDPLKSALPEHRLGPLGTAPKTNCATCHQGVNKPMYGANMTADHPAALGAAK